MNQVGCTINRDQATSRALRGSLDLRVMLGERHRGGVRHLSINSDHDTMHRDIS